MLPKKFWFVAKPHNGKEYYVSGIDPKTQAVVWTTRGEDALKFENLTSANSYITGYLKARKDVLVVKMTSKG